MHKFASVLTSVICADVVVGLPWYGWWLAKAIHGADQVVFVVVFHVIGIGLFMLLPRSPAGFLNRIAKPAFLGYLAGVISFALMRLRHEYLQGHGLSFGDVSQWIFGLLWAILMLSWLYGVLVSEVLRHIRGIWKTETNGN